MKAGPNWQAVKVGSTLKDTDELKVAENSYVGLVHVNGKPLEVKKAGKVQSSGSRAAGKWRNFCFEQIHRLHPELKRRKEKSPGRNGGGTPRTRLPSVPASSMRNAQ